MLLEDAPGHVGEIRSAIERGDAKQVEEAAHCLKGAAANLEAGPLRDAAQSLEVLGRERRLERAAPALAQLETELDRVSRFVVALG